MVFLQIGRSSESPIDFVVMDTVPGNKPTDKINTQSTISRFACRLLCNRDEGDLSAMIFAAGFDSSRNIFLGKPFIHTSFQVAKLGELTVYIHYSVVSGLFIK